MAETNIDPHDILQEDSEVTEKRNPRLRLSTSIVSALITAGLPIYLAMLLLSDWHQSLGLVVGLVTGIAILMPVVPRITINVPANQSIVTYDPWFKTNVVYGPGFHARHFWEQIDRTSHFSLKVITIKIPTETMPSQGANMLVSATIQVAPLLSRLEIFRNVDESTIEDGVISLVKAFLMQRIFMMDENEAKMSTERLSDEATELFNSPELYNSIGQKYGIRFIYVKVDDMDFTEGVQDARDAVAKAEPFTLVMATYAGLPVKSPDDIQRAKDALRTLYEKNPERYQSLMRLALVATGQLTGDHHTYELAGGVTGLENIGPAAAVLAAGAVREKNKPQRQPRKKKGPIRRKTTRGKSK